MRPSVVGVNKSGRPVVYHPPPPLLLPSGEQRQRPPLLLPSNQLLQLNPAMGRKRSRQNKSGQSRDRNSSYSSNDRMAVNGQTSRKRKAGQSADSGRQKKRERRWSESGSEKKRERKRRDSHIRKNNKKQFTSRQELRKKEKDKLPGIRNRRSSGENILN